MISIEEMKQNLDLGQFGKQFLAENLEIFSPDEMIYTNIYDFANKVGAFDNFDELLTYISDNKLTIKPRFIIKNGRKIMGESIEYTAMKARSKKIYDDLEKHIGNIVMYSILSHFEAKGITEVPDEFDDKFNDGLKDYKNLNMETVYRRAEVIMKIESD